MKDIYFWLDRVGLPVLLAILLTMTFIGLPWIFWTTYQESIQARTFKSRAAGIARDSGGTLIQETHWEQQPIMVGHVPMFQLNPVSIYYVRLPNGELANIPMDH